MSGNRRRLGQLGEELAARELIARRYELIERNWRCASGEIDLIAQDGTTLAIVEVRTRRGDLYGTPEESLTPRKQEKLVELGQSYVQEAGWPGPWRIDLVAVQLSAQGVLQRVTILKNIVQR